MTITRSEVLDRARHVWGPGTVPYSQETLHVPDGYRQDCSGYVSMAWGIPLIGTWGGPNTVSLVVDGWMHEIPINSLKLGDAVGRCGPGTDGDAGHVQLFTKWLNDDDADSHYYCLEQVGGMSGPNERFHDWTSGYRAYRFKGIADDPAPATRAFPLAYPPNVYGDIAGPSWCHGGYYVAERPVVAEIQRALIRAGCVPGITNPWSPWADGLFERPTVDAVRTFQSRHECTVDGLVGPQTWAALGPYLG